MASLDLPGAEPESERLATEHKYISKALGFAIHPTILASITANSSTANDNDNTPPNIRIASITPPNPSSPPQTAEEQEPPWDSAAAAELHLAAPNLTLTISHLTLSTLLSNPSAAPKPFDLLSLRLAHTALSPTADWATPLLALLRPGGWIQWVDWDPMTLRVAGTAPGSRDAATRGVLQAAVEQQRRARVGSLTLRIARVLGGEWAEADADLYPVVPEPGFTRCVVLGALRRVWGVGGGGGEGGDGAEGEMERVWEEVRGELGGPGCPAVWYDLWCHVARKKLEG